MTYDPDRRIQLTFSTPVRTAFRNRDSFRVMATAAHPNKMPAEIFGYQRTLLDPEQGTYCDEFCFVCSPFDLSIYPANAPDPAQTPQFFRKATFDIYVPGIEAADEVMADVEAQVCQLVTLLNKLDRMQTLDPVWCPSAPTGDTTSDTSAL